MVWETKFPHITILPLQNRIQCINESPNGHFDALVPDSALQFPTKPTNPTASTCPKLHIDRVLAKDLSKADQAACLDLIESTSAADYRASSMGWSRAKKRREMRLPDLRYLLLRTSRDATPAGFMSFMLTFEDGIEVIYLYEIHLQAELQGMGVGKQLVGILEEAGRVAEVKKVMLTVFKANGKAVGFYERLGFEEDEYSPRPRKLRNGVVKEPDYVILSKKIPEECDGVEVQRADKVAERAANAGTSVAPGKKRKTR